MSTKIYDAYKVVDLKPHELYKILRDIRKAYHYSCFNELTEYFKKDPDAKFIPTKDFLKLYDFLKNESESHRLAPFNFTASVVVFFDGDNMYLKFFGISWKVYEPLLTKKHFSDYHYQNSTDMPEEISEREWIEREKTWDRILGNANSYGEAGFIFELYKPEDAFELSMNFRKYLQAKGDAQCETL